MDAANQKVIDNLQDGCGLLAHLAEQYRLDERNLKYMGPKWLAKRVKCWYAGSEQQLKQFIGRLYYFEEAPEYEIGSVSSPGTVKDVLTAELALTTEAHTRFTADRKTAWNAEADFTTDVYEHAIHELEKQIRGIERELALVVKLTEPGYVGARLEDS